MKFTDYIKEDNQTKMNTIKAIYLISKKGELIEKSGYIVFGDGIYDDEKKSWVAAIGEDMKLYSTISDNDSLFTTVNNDSYNPQNSPQWNDNNGI